MIKRRFLTGAEIFHSLLKILEIERNHYNSKTKILQLCVIIMSSVILGSLRTHLVAILKLCFISKSQQLKDQKSIESDTLMFN